MGRKPLHALVMGGFVSLCLAILPLASSASTQPLVCDVPLDGAISVPTEVDTLTFNVTTNEYVGITFVSTSSNGPNFNPIWRVLRGDGTAVNSFSGSQFVDVGSLAVSGNPYRVQVEDSGGNEIGTYRIHLQRLTGAAACEATPLLCDTPLDGTIDDRTDSDLLTFNVSTNEYVGITFVSTSSNGPNFNPVCRMLRGDGTAVTSLTSSQFVDVGSLPVSGNPYRVEVKDSGENETGTYRIHLQRLTGAVACEATPLLCDTPLNGTINDRTDSDLLTFNVSTNEYVGITFVSTSSNGPNFNPVWRMLRGDGTAVTSLSSSQFVDVGSLPVSGNPYRVEVKDSGENETGTYRIHLQRLTGAAACEATPPVCDTPLNGTIDDRTDSDLLTFNVTTNEYVGITFVSTSSNGPNFNPIWRVLRGDGTAVTSLSSSQFTDVGSLPVSGNPYRVEVKDSGEDETGTYRIHLQRLTGAAACEATPLVCDTPLNGTIDDRTDSDLLTFNVSTNEYVGITFVSTSSNGPNFNPIWRVLRGDGTAVTSLSSSQFTDVGSLPVSGNPYRVEVKDSGENETGTYRVHLQRLTGATACEAIPLVCDTPLDGTIDDPTDSDLLTFNVTTNEYVGITFVSTNSNGPNFNPIWRVLRGDGTAVTSLSSSQFVDVGSLPVSGNPYRVEVKDSGENETGTYRIHLQRLTGAAACEATPLVCDTPLNGTIGDRTDSDLLAFNVSTNEYVGITFVPISSSGPNFNPVWRMLRGDGTAVTSLSSSQFTDVGSLPVSGNPYRVEVKDSGENETGTYRIHLQRLTASAVCDSATLICGRAIRDSIQDRTDSDLKSFQVADAASITVHTEVRWQQRPNFNPIWRILRSNGTALTGFNGFGVTTVNNMPASGNPYSVEIKDNGQDDVGAYSLEIRTSDCTTVAVDPTVPAPKTVELRISSPDISGGRSMVRIALANPTPGPVSLAVFNLLGQRVATLMNEDSPAGWHEIDWNTGSVPSGVYFVRLEVSAGACRKKYAFVR